MVITAGRQERCAVAVSLRHLEAQHIAVKPNRTLQVRHLEVHMADADMRVDDVFRHAGASPARDDTRCPAPGDRGKYRGCEKPGAPALGRSPKANDCED